MVGYSLETAQGLMQLSNPKNAAAGRSHFGAKHVGIRQGVPAIKHKANGGERTAQGVQ